MRGISVARTSAEAVRRRYRATGWLVPGVRPIAEGDRIVFAIAASAAPSGEDGMLVEREFARDDDGPASYRDLLLDLPDGVRAALPRAFDVVGDIVLVRLEGALTPWAERIGTALLEFVPGARIVGWDRGVHGDDRVRELHRLAGWGGWATEHRENGIAIEVDLARAYFSPRLAREHAHVAALVRPGETIADVCCGVGPFALTIAAGGAAEEIVAIDRNPAAIELLRRSAARLRHGDRIRTIHGAIPAALAEEPGRARVVYNLPREGIKYLTSVGTVVERGGSLHYYEMTERTRSADRGRELVAHLASVDAFTVVDVHVVHPYAPTIDLVAYTLRRGGR